MTGVNTDACYARTAAQCQESHFSDCTQSRVYLLAGHRLQNVVLDMEQRLWRSRRRRPVGLPEAGRSRQQLPEATSSRQKPPEAASNSQQPPATARSRQQLPEATSNSQKPPATARSRQQPPATARSRQQPPEAASKSQKPVSFIFVLGRGCLPQTTTHPIDRRRRSRVLVKIICAGAQQLREKVAVSRGLRGWGGVPNALPATQNADFSEMQGRPIWSGSRAEFCDFLKLLVIAMPSIGTKCCTCQSVFWSARYIVLWRVVETP